MGRQSSITVIRIALDRMEKINSGIRKELLRHYSDRGINPEALEHAVDRLGTWVCELEESIADLKKELRQND
jgi:hypothetical protein